MASLGHFVANRRASSIHCLPTPCRCRSGATTIDVRYNGRWLGLKYFLSMDHGFRVESARVAIRRWRCMREQMLVDGGSKRHEIRDILGIGDLEFEPHPRETQP